MSEALTLDDYPRDLTRDEELMSLGEDDTIEMTNLHEEDTGVPGVLFVSSKIASHGPRVKYYLQKGGDPESYSVSIEGEPRVLASSMSRRDLNRTVGPVLAWITLNQEPLLRLWHEGEGLPYREFTALIDSLRKV